MKFLIFRPAAAADVDEAYDWYESRRSGLGEEFLEAVRQTLLRVETQPEQYPVIRRKIRRALLQRFPYGLYYRVYEDHIVIVACMHGRRSPRRWQSRL